MRKTSLRKVFAAILFAATVWPSDAQIVLHEARDITQTKATLSADFTDAAASLGAKATAANPLATIQVLKNSFEYKLGSLPEIDDFSRIALDPLSDPVQISTTDKNWSARTVKGWVESQSNLSAGQSSTMSTSVTLYDETTVTFEWSVDSEEDYGILSFNVDGTTVEQISGLVDFKTVSYKLAAGEHTLAWTYSKTSATNVGLDLGMVRNINIQNTTSGKWKTVWTGNSEATVRDLHPGSKYIYRACYTDNPLAVSGARFTRSAMQEFATLPVTINSVTIDPVTQTTAIIKADIDKGDANLKATMKLPVPNNVTHNIQRAALNKFSMPVTRFSYVAKCVVNNTDSCDYISVCGSYSNSFLVAFTVDVKVATQISFDYASEYDGVSFYIGDEHYSLGRSTSYLHKAYTIPAGTHRIQWYVKGRSVVDLCLKEIKVGVNTTTIELTDVDSEQGTVITGLIPATEYAVRLRLGMSNDTIPEWQGVSSGKQKFTTLPVAVDSISVKDIKQASATICGKVDGGDATIVAAGLQYKDAAGTRWTDYPKDVTQKELSERLARLKPNTKYNYRAYIQADKCNRVYSALGEFTTKTVQALIPTVVRKTQHTAKLQGEVRFGDASIYQRGMQFRKYGDTEWQEVEDGGSDTIYTLERKDLEMGGEYEARTYIQPAGCDVIYSDILQFSTERGYFTNLIESDDTYQTRIDLSAKLTEIDDGVSVEEYGLEYYVEKDGLGNILSDSTRAVRIPLTPVDGLVASTVNNLAPSCTVCYRLYARVKGEYFYYTSNIDSLWDKVCTGRGYIKVMVKQKTQTTVTLGLDATQEDIQDGALKHGDAVVTNIGYASAEHESDTVEYTECGTEVTLSNLLPDTKYNLKFCGTVNGMQCPLMTVLNADFSWYEFTTESMKLSATFTNIKQCSATMNLNLDKGDAQLERFEYQLINANSQPISEYKTCGSIEQIMGLVPDTKYYVKFRYTINGVTKQWEIPSQFTTKPLELIVTITDRRQCSVTMNVNFNPGDAQAESLEYQLLDANQNPIGGYKACGSIERFTELAPSTKYYLSFRYMINGEIRYWNPMHEFTTRPVSVNADFVEKGQTYAIVSVVVSYGDATYVDGGIEYGIDQLDSCVSNSGNIVLTELEPNTRYRYRAFVETKETGRKYTNYNYFITSVISCATNGVSNISNRSATMNGTIDCDDYSSAEFGFQWKAMTGWESAPAFTKGVKKEDGTISVALVNGMLEPNTDYQYRTAVRYKGNIYYADTWETFRTEMEFVYYPADVYTIYRTDRENNCLVLCGYFVAGSEEIISQGYEYWRNSSLAKGATLALSNIVTVNTDATMQHSLDLTTLPNGNYNVRAFVTTASGKTIYGETLTFGVENGGFVSVEETEAAGVTYSITGTTLTINNAATLGCRIYTLGGNVVEARSAMGETEQFLLAPNTVYVVKLSNGMTRKIEVRQ